VGLPVEAADGPLGKICEVAAEKMTQNVLIKYALILFAICLIASAFLSGAYTMTRPKIEAQKRSAEAEALRYVMPQAEGGFEEVKGKSGMAYYNAYADKAKSILLGCVFKTVANGYSSKIEIIAGVTRDGQITGIKVLSQEETPGLGARVDEILSKKTLWHVFKSSQLTVDSSEQRPWFCEQFRGKALGELKNVQAITGATITSTAVVKAVRNKAQEILASGK